MMSASFWLMLALVLGLTITAIGMIDGVDKSFFPKLSAVRCPECHELFSEWAPHFGPELLVLVFAALLIDRNRIVSAAKEFAVKAAELEATKIVVRDSLKPSCWTVFDHVDELGYRKLRGRALSDRQPGE